MSSFVRFGCTSLAGVNKAGNIKKDERGYYKMVVGGLNVFNSAGEFYVYEEAKALFEQSSQLMRRVSRGALRGEYGHPKMEAGMSPDDFAQRVLTINEGNVCCHHKELSLDFENVRDAQGRPMIAIISSVAPNGPLGGVLEKQLNNPDENVCFSIRAFTDNYRERGITKRVLKTVITFDYVNEPGISAAEKYKSPALESFKDDGLSISRAAIERAMDHSKHQGIATESAMLTAQELFVNMGWDTSHFETKKPHYSKW